MEKLIATEVNIPLYHETNFNGKTSTKDYLVYLNKENGNVIVYVKIVELIFWAKTLLGPFHQQDLTGTFGEFFDAKNWSCAHEINGNGFFYQLVTNPEKAIATFIENSKQENQQKKEIIFKLEPDLGAFIRSLFLDCENVYFLSQKFRKIEYFLQVPESYQKLSELIIITAPVLNYDYDSFEILKGTQNNITKMKLEKVERFRDGGTTIITFRHQNPNSDVFKLHLGRDKNENYIEFQEYHGKIKIKNIIAEEFPDQSPLEIQSLLRSIVKILGVDIHHLSPQMLKDLVFPTPFCN